MATNSKAVLIASAIASFVGFGAARLINKKEIGTYESMLDDAFSAIEEADKALTEGQKLIDAQDRVIEQQKKVIRLREIKEEMEKTFSNFKVEAETQSP